MNERDFLTRFPVQLSKEEYIHSQELLSKHLSGNRFLGGGRWFSLVTLVFLILMTAADWKAAGKPDFSMIGMMILFIIMEGIFLFSFPRLIRKNSGRAYEMTLYTGYTFEGILEVTAADIRKQTADGDVVIDYNDCLAYVEAADMMIFCTKQGKSIVIPARCLTAEDADTVRRAAFAGISPDRRLLAAKLIPATEKRLPIPDLTKQDEETLLSLSVEYTEKEIKEIVADAFFSETMHNLPVKGMLSVGIAMVVSLWYEAAMIPLFLLCFLLFVFVPSFTVRFKAKKLVRVTRGDVQRLVVRMTPYAIWKKGTTESGKGSRIPWSSVTRAVERRDRVDLYHVKTKLLTIPKRCIPDMEELRRIVDDHMQVKD